MRASWPQLLSSSDWSHGRVQFLSLGYQPFDFLAQITLTIYVDSSQSCCDAPSVLQAQLIIIQIVHFIPLKTELELDSCNDCCNQGECHAADSSSSGHSFQCFVDSALISFGQLAIELGQSATGRGCV